MSNMIFQHTWRNVLAPFVPELARYQPKTETRRLAKPSEILKLRPEGGVAVFTPQGKVRFAVGDVYPVMPVRGEQGAKSVGVIRIISLINQDVRELTQGQACAEGFKSIDEFLHVWKLINDRKALVAIESPRPRDKYIAWAITFKVEDVFLDAVAQALAREGAEAGAR